MYGIKKKWKVSKSEIASHGTRRPYDNEGIDNEIASHGTRRPYENERIDNE